jgi:hypothetical protein
MADDLFSQQWLQARALSSRPVQIEGDGHAQELATAAFFAPMRERAALHDLLLRVRMEDRVPVAA